MAEQFLDGAQIAAARQQMGRERMPQRMRADAEAQAAARDIAGHEAMDAARHQEKLSLSSTLAI